MPTKPCVRYYAHAVAKVRNFVSAARQSDLRESCQVRRDQLPVRTDVFRRLERRLPRDAFRLVCEASLWSLGTGRCISFMPWKTIAGLSKPRCFPLTAHIILLWSRSSETLHLKVTRALAFVDASVFEAAVHQISQI